MRKLLKYLLPALFIAGLAYAADINDLSTTDASNNSCWSEGMAPSNVNNCARADLGLIARWYRDWNGSLAAGGSSNAYTLSANQTLSAYFDGLTVTFEANHTNSGGATLNIDSVGAATISKYGAVELDSGDIASGQKYTVTYDGTYFQLVNSMTPTGGSPTSGNIALFSGTTGRFTDSGVASTGISALSSAGITAVRDEDNMSSDSATSLATQQSIKAYVDTSVAAIPAIVSAITEGSITSDADLQIPFTDTDCRKVVVTISDFVPETNAANLLLRTSTDAGSSYDSGASDYGYSNFIHNTTATFISSSGDSTADSVVLVVTQGNNTTTDRISGDITIFDPSTAVYKRVKADIAFGNGGFVIASGVRVSAGNVNGVRLHYSSGGIASGRYKVFCYAE